MGEINFKSFDKPKRHKNTKLDEHREIHTNRLDYVIDRITEVDRDLLTDKSVFIYGMGKHPKSTYENLRGIDGISVICYKSLLPRVLRPLKGLIASYFGLVKIIQLPLLKGVFEQLINLSMAGIYIMDKKYENEFIESVRSSSRLFDVNEIVKRDKEYFIYCIDADNVESSTGILEIVSFGVECPNDLTSILTLTGR